MKISIGILLALGCTTLCLISCSTSEENLSSITLDSSYTVVCPADANDTDLKILEKFYELMASRCEGIQVIDDNEEDDNADTEILIGDTNRPESKEVIIDSNEKYTIKVVNNKLVIKAGSSLALDAACLYFSERIEKEGLTFPKDYEYNGVFESSEEKYVLVGDQSNKKVTVYDVSNGYVDSTAVWSVSPSFTNGVAGQKVRDTTKFGKVVLCCAHTSADVISYPDGEKVWTTTSAAPGGHSIDITPDGKILAVASASSGNAVRFFNTDGDSDKYTEVPVMDAHGVVYDEKNDCFWVIGVKKIRAFRARLDSDGTINVEKVEQYRLPIEGAHDLQPYQGDENKLWVTGASGVCVFDKISGESVTTFENSEIIDRMQLKGLSSFRDGSVVFVYPDSEFYQWTSSSFVCSYKLAFAETECFLTLQLPENTHIYKIRAFVSDYTY